MFKRHDIEWTQQKTSRFWDFISNNKPLSNKYFGLNAGEHFISLINRKIKIAKMNRILDVSCGKGHILNHVLIKTNDAQEIYGTDFSEENVKYVNENFSDVNRFKGATKQNGYTLNYKDNYFSLIILTEVIEHLNDSELDHLLNETQRILIPNGYLAITTPNNEDLEASKLMCPDCGCVFHRWQHLRSWTQEGLKKTLETYSFKTSYCTEISWSSTIKERIALRLAEYTNLIKPQGIIYIGMKSD